MDLSIKDLNCPICFELAEDAVEASCCSAIYCAKCSLKVRFLSQQRCVLCSESCDFKPSRFLRKHIGRMAVRCRVKGCEESVLFSKRSEHEERCPFRLNCCVWCSAEMMHQDLLLHVFESHPKEADSALMRVVEISNFFRLAECQDYDPLRAVKNESGRMARLGESGKYYCGGQIEVKCYCCEGNCGPKGGFNCKACMKLDVAVRKLDYGRYLVNTGGRIARMIGGHAYCGVLLGERNLRCEREQCRECGQLTQHACRYVEVGLREARSQCEE